VKEPAGRLAALQAAIEEVMSPMGYPPEGRPFTPHLTLGRINRRTPRSKAARVGEVVANAKVNILGDVAADRFGLIRSVLKPTGAEYTMLEEFELRGGG
jgi:2'-5' RNA ligase